MKSAVITAPKTIEERSVSVPEPADDEVRIRLEGCGLCASDMPVWQGRDWFSYPIKPGSPGHEGWGTVEAVGKDVQYIHEGYRVAALCYNAYAEYDVAKACHVVELPDLFDSKPIPGEPLACAMNIFKRSCIKKGSTTAIVGAGWLGLLLIQLAKNAEADVIAISRRPSSLEKAKEFGADYTFSTEENPDIIKQVEDITGGDLCSCVIEAAGKQETLDLAGELTGVKGRLVIAGYHQDGQRKVNMQLWNWRGMDVINAHERNPAEYVRGMREAVKYMNKKVLNPFPLITHTFPLKDIQQAFKAQEQKPENFTKALITIE